VKHGFNHLLEEADSLREKGKAEIRSAFAGNYAGL
jgi:hypothetical protein